jgi:hypothetical protein
MNKGVSDLLKAAFSTRYIIPRPSVLDYNIKNPNWLAGFTDAEGCFGVKIKKSNTNKIGYQVVLVLCAVAFELSKSQKE